MRSLVVAACLLVAGWASSAAAAAPASAPAAAPVVPAAAKSASPGASANTSADEATLRRLSVEWMQALERKDRAALEATLAPDYRLRFPGDPVAKATDRATWLKNAMEMDWTRFTYENVEVRVRGDLGVVSSHLRFHVSPMPFELDSGVVDVWERRNGRWQVVERMLGESATQGRIGFWSGVSIGVLACVAWSLLARWRRRRRARAAAS
jgi:ketosteroid isomerase-like protein